MRAAPSVRSLLGQPLCAGPKLSNTARTGVRKGASVGASVAAYTAFGNGCSGKFVTGAREDTESLIVARLMGDRRRNTRSIEVPWLDPRGRARRP